MSGSHLPQHTRNEKYAESMMNMALLDPPRWGWPAVGGVTDLLTPHERARRKETKKGFLKTKKRKRGRPTSSAASKSPSTAEKSAATPTAERGLTNQAEAAAATSYQAAIQPEVSETPGSLPVPQPLTTNGDNKDRKDNPLQVQLEEDCKPAAKQSQSQPQPTTDGNVDAKSPGCEGKTQNISSEGTPKPSANDATTKDAAMTDSSLAATEKPNASARANQVTGAKSDETTTTKGLEIEDGVLKIEALRGDGGLDIYAYHRGREGMEPRDAATGELLCDVEQTDTNYKWDEPKLALQMNISFPLTDNESAPHGSNADVPMFEETICWNLGDPETPTPIAFATNTAERFGLTFGQTQDLAVSIQQQIFRHVRDHCGYPEPVAITDGAGMDRAQIPPPTVCHMYGGVVETVKPGTFCANAAPPSKSKSKKYSYSAQGSSSRRSAAAAANSEETVRERSRPPPIEYFDDDPVEDIYVEEVRKRMVEYSREDVATKCEENGMPNGRLHMMQNYVCHICHKRHSLVGKFACGFQSHSYCKTHLQNRLDLTVGSVNDEVVFDYCPVCAVTCLCSKCGRRRDALAIQLKRKSQQQGADPSSTVFEDMFTCFTKPAAAIRIAKQAKQAAAQSRRRETVEPQPAASAEQDSVVQEKAKPTPKQKAHRKPSIQETEEEEVAPVVVPLGSKPPPSHFPREFRNGVDVDPGSAIDYRTVYTAEGHYVKDLASLPTPKTNGSDAPPAVAEDGNVDYCHKCKSGGSLLCCDYCPRAFHPRCLDGDDNDESGGTWECPVCKRAKQDLPEYTLSGSESQSKICAAYSELKVDCDDDLTQLTMLSKIHEMLEKLMQTDFGPVFAVPVDPKTAPGYDKIIKKPMDLGTIASKLLNGGYKKCFEAHNSWADIHLAVLKDIELVWNNCFTFNYEGSSYYKMAEDLRRRMIAMRARSLDNDLPDSVLHKLDEYVKTSRKERGKIPVPSQFDGRPKSRYKIMVQSQRVGRSTKVAILDPATGMVIKIYTTIKTAHKAAEDLIKRGYTSELSASYNEFALKTLIKRSTDDPSATLFGYRWLELDKLHNGQVRFSPQEEKPVATTVFEVKDGKASHIFLSLDEAITHRLSREKPAEELRKALQQLTEGGEEIKIFGLQWRRRKLTTDGKALHKDIMLTPFWESNGNKPDKEAEEPVPTATLVAKEDRILGRTTGRFETLEAAFEDWEFACKASPSIPVDEISQSSFFTHYLNGDRNVDGVIWKIVEQSDDVETDDPKSVAPGDSQMAASTACETTMSQSPTLVSNEVEDEKEVPVREGEGAERRDATEVENQVMAVEPAVENVQSPPDDKQLINESHVKARVVGPEVNGFNKRERSEEEVMMARKK